MPDLTFFVSSYVAPVTGDEEDVLDKIVDQKLSDIIADAEAQGLECECVKSRTGPLMTADIMELILGGVTIIFFSFAKTLVNEAGKSAWSLIVKSGDKLYRRFIASDRNLKFRIVRPGQFAEPEHGDLRLMLRVPECNVVLAFKNGSSRESFSRSLTKFSELMDLLRDDPSKAANILGESDKLPREVCVELDEENNSLRRIRRTLPLRFRDIDEA